MKRAIRGVAGVASLATGYYVGTFHTHNYALETVWSVALYAAGIGLIVSALWVRPSARG